MLSSDTRDWRAGIVGLVGLCLLMLVSASAFSAEAGADAAIKRVLIVDEQLSHVNLGPYLAYLEDPGGKFTFEQISSPEYAARFAGLPDDKIAFGRSPDPHWFRFRLTNSGWQRLQLYLRASYPLLDLFEVYVPDGEAYRQITLGDQFPFDHRILPISHFVVPIEMLPHGTSTIYMRIQTTSNFATDLHLSAELPYLKFLHDEQTVIGIFYGFALCLIAYNLFLFASTREPAQLWFTLYVLFTIGYESNLDGLQYEMLGFATAWQQIASLVLGMAAAIFFLYYTIYTLGLRDRARWMINGMRIGIGLHCVVIVGLLTLDIATMVGLFGFSAIYSLLFSFVVGMVRLFQGSRSARYYVASFLVLFVVGIVTFLSAVGMMHVYAEALVGFKLALALQMIMLALALADRINSLKDQRVRLRQQALIAETRSQSTSDFLATMSHEIRTPINGVLGTAALMEDTELNGIQSRYLDVITSSGRALLGVINDVLDFSKITAGKMDLEVIDGNLETLLNECVSVFSLKAEQAGLEFYLTIRPGTPVKLRFDPTRVRQVVLNLLGNAFKFTETGGIVLRAFPVEGEDGQPLVQVEVQDSGIGISEDAQGRLFESFSQADASTTRKFGGTGLGLAICKKLAELMGGTIGVHSVPGEGATFWFRIPATPAEMPDEVPDCSTARFEELHLLLVTGLVSYASAIGEELAQYGIHLDVCTTGDEALERIRSAEIPYRVIAIGRDSVDLDPLELCAKLREQGCGEDSEIVLVSTLREAEEAARLRKHGFSAVMGAPLSSAQTRDALEEMLSAPTDATGRKKNAADCPDFSHLKVLVVDDNDVNLMVVSGLLNKFKIQPEKASDGREALERFKAAEPPYDLVVMDCEMPEMDGLTAAREMRLHESAAGHEPAVIIALSAHAMLESRQASLDAGMNDHMTKPVSINALQDKLSEWCGTAKSAQPA